MLTITDSARDKIKEVLDNNPGKHVRVFIQGGGWGGPQLGLALDEPGEGEATTQVNGVAVLIRDDVLPYAWSTQVDYVSTPYAEGFTIGSGGSSCC